MDLVNWVIKYFVDSKNTFKIKHHSPEDFVKRSQIQKKTRQTKQKINK